MPKRVWWWLKLSLLMVKTESYDSWKFWNWVLWWWKLSLNDGGNWILWWLKMSLIMAELRLMMFETETEHYYGWTESYDGSKWVLWWLKLCLLMAETESYYGWNWVLCWLKRSLMTGKTESYDVETESYDVFWSLKHSLLR